MKRIIMASITAVVVIAVMAGTLIPILDDATATSDTFTNEGYFRVSQITEDTDITISWTYEKPKVITVGTQDVDVSNIPVDLAVTFVGTDDCVTRYQSYASGTAQRIQSYSDSMNYSGTSSTSISSGVFSVVINGFNLTYSHNGSTMTSTITSGFYIDPAGDYVMKYNTSSAYIHTTDSIIMLSGNTSGSTSNVGLYATGTVDDGLDFTSVNIGTNTVSYGDVTFNYTEDSDHVDLISLTSCVFEITLTTTESVTSTIDATYSYFVVPYEVTAERSVHFTDGENAIFNAIPVMIIIALLLGVVALVLRSRMD